MRGIISLFMSVCLVIPSTSLMASNIPFLGKIPDPAGVGPAGMGAYNQGKPAVEQGATKAYNATNRGLAPTAPYLGNYNTNTNTYTPGSATSGAVQQVGRAASQSGSTIRGWFGY